MEKAFQKGFLLKGSTKPKAESEKKKTPSDYNDPKSEANDKSLMLEIPKELLEHIFKFLDPGTIKAVACVCKWWKKIVEKRPFWKWAKVKMIQFSEDEKFYSNSIQKLKEIVGSPRLHFLEEIHLLDTREIRGYMNQIGMILVKMKNLKTVVFSVGMPGTHTETTFQKSLQVIATLVSSVENFELKSLDVDDKTESIDNVLGLTRQAGYSKEITKAILRELVTNDKSKTRSLNINIQGGYILQEVDPDLFSKGAMKLENLSIMDAGITQQQGQNFLECLATSESAKLKHLSLDLNLINIRPKILSHAVTKLTQLSLCRPKGAPEMTYEQASSIFCKMKSEESALRELSLSGSQVGHSFDDMPIRYGS